MKEIEESSISHILTEAWAVNEFFVRVNGCELREADVLDIEVMYGGCSIDASVMFLDTEGIFSGEAGTASLAQGGILSMGWNAAGSCGGEYEGAFSIEKVRSTEAKNQKIVILDLVDAHTRSLKGTHVTKGFQQTKFSDGIKTFMEEEAGASDLIVKGADNENTRDWIIPSNMNFHTWLEKSGAQNGMKLIKDKFNSYFVSGDFTEYNKIDVSPFEFEVDADNQYSFGRILQYNLDGFDMSAVMDTIPMGLSNNSQVVTGTGDEAKSKTSALDSKQSAQEAGTAGVPMVDSVKSRGNKQGVKHTETQHQYFTSLSNAQKCSIWVPGLNANRVGKKVTVKFPRPNYLKQNQYDNVFSGYWEVYAVRDKIIKQYFIQEIFLRRTGGS